MRQERTQAAGNSRYSCQAHHISGFNLQAWDVKISAKPDYRLTICDPIVLTKWMLFESFKRE